MVHDIETASDMSGTAATGTAIELEPTPVPTPSSKHDKFSDKTIQLDPEVWNRLFYPAVLCR